MILVNKKIKELQSENDELKKFIQSFTEKEEHLKRFDELIKKIRIEYADLAQKKDQTALTLEVLEAQKAKLNSEILKVSSDLKQLRELKVAEHNQLLTLSTALLQSGNSIPAKSTENLSNAKLILYKEIESAEKKRQELEQENKKLEKKFEDLYKRIVEINDVKQTLDAEIEKKKRTISELIDKQNSIASDQAKIFNKSFEDVLIHNEKITETFKTKLEKLSAEEKKLLEKINNHNKKLQEIESQIQNKNLRLINFIRDQKSTAQKLQSQLQKSIESLTLTERLKKDLIQKLDEDISAKKNRLDILNNEYITKTKELYKTSFQNKQLLKELQFRRHKLFSLNEALDLKTARINNLALKLNALEDKLISLNDETLVKESINAEMNDQINKTEQKRIRLEEKIKELRETITILEKLKNDIEEGSGLSVKRFAGVLKFYSKQITMLYKKKRLYEKMLRKKAKDVIEKDRELDKKQSALDKLDKALFIRQQRVEILKDLLKKLQDFQSSLNINTGYTDKELPVIQGQILIEKFSKEELAEFEIALEEILQRTKETLENSDKSIMLNTEIDGYNRRVANLNRQIRESVNELDKLKSSITKIKIEHESHRQDINKLIAIKNQLGEKLKRYKGLLSRFLLLEKKIEQQKQKNLNSTDPAELLINGLEEPKTE